VEIAALSMEDLREAHRKTSREDASTQHAIATERRRRWSAAHRARTLTRRQQRTYRRRSGFLT